jgi:hypothetical protein
MFRRSRSAACAAALLALAAGPALALAADGDEDPSFNNGQGSVVADLSDLAGDFGQVRDPMVVQAADGDLVAAAQVRDEMPRGMPVSGDSLGVIRVRQDGSFETAFDGDGRALIPTGGDLRLLDLKLLNGGTVAALTDAGGQLAVQRIADTGAAGPRTVVVEPECAGTLALDAAVLRADGGVVALWTCEAGDATTRLLTRSASDGALQGTTTITGAGIFYPDRVVLGPDRIYVAGNWFAAENAPIGTKVIAYDASGARVDGFDAELADETFADIAVDGLGRVVLGMDTNSKPWRLVRLTTAGALDTTYSGDGRAAVDGENLGFSVIRITPLDSGAILALGFLEGGSGNGYVLVRVTPEGELDTAFAGGEGRTYDDPCNALFDGPVIVQADGKVVLTFAGFGGFGENPACFPSSTGEVRSAARAFDPPSAPFLAIARLDSGRPPQTTTTTTTTTQAQTQTQAVPPPPEVRNEQPSLQPCRSARNFRIRLRTGRRPSQQSPIVRALVTVNGKRVRVTRSDRVRARVDLRGLPRRKVVVRIRLRLKDGGVVRDVRRYNPCVRGRLPFTIRPLRTFPPKK